MGKGGVLQLLARTGCVICLALCCNHFVWISVSIACFNMDSCITSVKVGLRDIEYKKEYKGDEFELQYAVEEHLYPPAISLQVVQSEVPRHLRLHKRILLRIHGAKEGAMNFPIDIYEEQEGVS